MPKITPEHEMRAKILNVARELKCEQDVLKIFHKYDGLLKNCTNEQEKRAIAVMANLEIHRFLTPTPGGIMIDGIWFEK